jgi:hypothetical protein
MLNDEVKAKVIASLAKMALVLVFLGGLAAYVYHAFTAAPSAKIKEVIEVIQSEELSFLVMDRLVTKVVVESKENSALLGKREGYLIATVRLYYGIDLKSLSEDAVQVTDGTIYVTLPEPKELDFSVDLDSARFLSKRSGLIVLRDFLRDLNFQQELERQLRQAAEKMLNDEALLPKREDLVRRLNAWAPALSHRLGLKILFR